jgi:hypothetical protein
MPILPSGSRMRPIHAAWVCRAERRSGRRTGRPDMFAQHILGRAFVNYGRAGPRHRRGRTCPSRRPTRASHPHSGAKTIDSTRGGRTPHSSARHSADRATRHVDDPGHWPPPAYPPSSHEWLRPGKRSHSYSHTHETPRGVTDQARSLVTGSPTRVIEASACPRSTLAIRARSFPAIWFPVESLLDRQTAWAENEGETPFLRCAGSRSHR